MPNSSGSCRKKLFQEAPSPKPGNRNIFPPEGIFTVIILLEKSHWQPVIEEEDDMGRDGMHGRGGCSRVEDYDIDDLLVDNVEDLEQNDVCDNEKNLATMDMDLDAMSSVMRRMGHNDQHIEEVKFSSSLCDDFQLSHYYDC
uniref:Uncharacterized protein n=1 Tax=Nelumbo nucifera TaxID=4432 RepID=A0A822XI45_NELNU|nr:TPA_asm: hypothetical protein HUJ06_020129 [Nelumbo nucifera]